METVRLEPAISDHAKAELAILKPARVEPARKKLPVKPARADPSRVEFATADPAREDPA